MMLLRFGRVTGLRSIPLRKTQSLQFSDDKKDAEKQKVEQQPDEEKTTESVANKLNRLLASMNTDDNLTFTKKVEIPKAGGRSKIKKTMKMVIEEVEKKPKNIIEAAKEVANVLDAGADPHQKRKTESELLSKLLNHIDSTAASPTDNAIKESRKDSSDVNLNDIIVGMKIDRKRYSKDAGSKLPFTRSQYVRKALSGGQVEISGDNRSRQPYRRQLTEAVPHSGSVNLFGEEPLGIFKDPASLKDSPDMLKTWSMLENRELKLAITRPPKNYFEKMIMWTEQGKIWKFPIDNEQGLEEEQNVDFSEHIFLEQHLEGWCPTKGPIRHFMELVCVGLSKNPYITAEEKRDHINWFKDYFEEKKEILKELIQEKEQQQKITDNKQIQSS